MDVVTREALSREALYGYKGKGDPLACGSYRAIKLLELGMKVYERVLEKRIRGQVNINSMQFGFMPGRVPLMPSSLSGRFRRSTGRRRRNYTMPLWTWRRPLTVFQERW